ncbi:MAG: hypothetical protein H0W82_02290 [Actinobacteria bacterium]|nr:hypothetical protein [Actinomycetota bacterium]
MNADYPLPAALSKPAAIRRIYPDLAARAGQRIEGRGHISWERLRRQARTRWMRQHPCANATLNRLHDLGRSSWSTVVATWRCDGVSPSWQSFMGCIADHEGGRTYPDVRFGGGRGYPGGLGNVVFGHFQMRPGWYRGAMEGRRGTYAGDYWTPELYRYALNPIHQARLAEVIGPEAYATAGAC